MDIQYFKIKEQHLNYKGEKYFKFDPLSNHVVQVCVDSKCKKKGKTQAIGVYQIARLTFLSNYYTFYVDISNKKEFESKYFEVITNLLN